MPDPRASAREYLAEAIELARRNVRERGARPFGAVIVRDGKVVATGVNDVLATNDPSKHAEMEAIRAAAVALGSPSLEGCVMYASGQPCPMCVAAMQVAGIRAAYYAYASDEAGKHGLSSVRASVALEHLPVDDAGEHPYEVWRRSLSPR